jgi:hypothetical protein
MRGQHSLTSNLVGHRTRKKNSQEVILSKIPIKFLEQNIIKSNPSILKKDYTCGQVGFVTGKQSLTQDN